VEDDFDYTSSFGQGEDSSLVQIIFDVRMSYWELNFAHTAQF